MLPKSLDERLVEPIHSAPLCLTPERTFRGNRRNALHDHVNGLPIEAHRPLGAPSTARVALLFNPTTAPPLQIYLSSIQAAAPSFRVEVSTAPVHAKDEIEGVIAEQARNPGGGLIVMPDLSNTANRDLIISLAARYRVPAIYFIRLIAESGGLIAYGTDFVELVRQTAGYIDRILKGAKPADLPIQLPSKFELVINLKTAKTLGLTIPQTLLATADEVIE
jgi:putative tryptophan/tyrosine transport system substrate-binding protein